MNPINDILPMEEVCIMTTLQDEPNYKYKLAHSAKQPVLMMNASDLQHDQLFVCYRTECVDAENTVKDLQNLLHDFYDNNYDFFVISFDTLRDIVNLACRSNCDLYNRSLQVIENERVH